VDVLAALKIQDSTLNRKQLFAQLDTMLAEKDLPPVPEHVKRGVMLKTDMRVHGVITQEALNDVEVCIFVCVHVCNCVCVCVCVCV
jgi:hypothetical protein